MGGFKSGGSRRVQTLLFFVIVAGVIGVLIYAADHPQPRPPIPRDENHAGIGEWTACLDCHVKDGMSPLPPSHPISNEKCFRCHQEIPEVRTPHVPAYEVQTDQDEFTD